MHQSLVLVHNAYGISFRHSYIKEIFIPISFYRYVIQTRIATKPKEREMKGMLVL
jgi:hypothetical protein